MFDPKTDKYPYPEETDKHYLKIKMDRGIVFDTKYPYIDRSSSFLFKQKLVRILLNVIVFPLCRIRLGLKIEGRDNIKKYHDELSNGVISISNHIHMWDYISVMLAIKPFKSYLLSWASNVNDKDGPLVRLVGGIPIPETNMAATKKYMETVEDLLKKDGGWLHIYPEGSMWEYYAPVRPFKRGPAFIACECDKPILPLGFSYREPGWIRKNIFHQIATLTLRIGEPIYPNNDLNPRDREKDLTVRCHDAVCILTGTDPKDSIYEPVYNRSKRIDY